MELPKIYDPKLYEADIYARWEKAGLFTPSAEADKESFSVVMPPPNANAELHSGHALDFQLKDIIGRWQRAQGKQVLLLPGADHAGFETWVVYEQHLNQQGKSRFDFSRDELYQQVWDFVEGAKEKMVNQVRRLGISCDWQRFCFSLDERIVNQAYQTFEKLWQEGLIYRGKRLVSYCTQHGTAFSDIEVEHEPIKGHLWQIAYPLTDGSGQIVIATTRPETLLGDTAVAVHPKDSRYRQAWGKQLRLPLAGREIPVICDDRVDKQFGTGAVKITPAHDFNDYALAKDHGLALVEIIDKQGLITEAAPKAYQGLTVKQARAAVLKDLEAGGQLVKKLDYRYNISRCYKCQTPIEPLLSEQWFVKMRPLAKAAIKQLKAKAIDCYPDKKRLEIIAYLDQLEDWNISRQIAWGIPIPVFQNVDQTDDWIFDTRVDQETIQIKDKTYRRDPDVFDTWWSSGQWPYASLDYGSDSPDSRRFYPTSLMETGTDLLRQWISRMIMLGVYVTGQVPFKQLYLHGMVLDKHGLKMSKSRGNVINPLEMVDKYGSDALRLGLVAGTSPGQAQHFYEDKVVGGRNFCNKLWNIARYVIGNLPSTKTSAVPRPQTMADHWILQRQATTSQQLTKTMTAYRIGAAHQLIYDFIWHDLADWYLEASKLGSEPEFVADVLKTSLKLVHPFVPFVSEAIWQYLTSPGQPTDMLICQQQPDIQPSDGQQAKQFAELATIIAEIREIQAEQPTQATLKLEHLNCQLLAEPTRASETADQGDPS